MLKLLAILPLFLSSPALGAPAGRASANVTTPEGTVLADDVDYNDEKAPDDVHEVSPNGPLEGYRAPPVNYDVTARCYIVDGVDEHGNPLHGNQKHGIKLECIQSLRQVTYDIRRIGQYPVDCGAGTTTEKWSVSDSDTKSAQVKISTETRWEFIKSALDVELSDQRTHAETFERTLSCGDYKGVKCLVGGLALVEVKVRRGWVDHVTTWDQSHPGTMLPQWDHFTDAPDYGMWDIEEETIYKFNPLYANGWDIWNARDHACDVGGGRSYDSKQTPA